MSIRALRVSALRSFDEIPAREFGLVVFVCLVMLTLNTLVVAYGIGYLNGERIACGCHAPLPRDYFYDFMRLKIEIALLVIAAALRFRMVVGLYVSLLATVLIEVQYALWYLDTQRWLREMHVSNFSQMPVPSQWPNFAGLYLATPWDFVIFVFTTALFIWQIRVVIALINSARRRKQPA